MTVTDEQLLELLEDLESDRAERKESIHDKDKDPAGHLRLFQRYAQPPLAGRRVYRRDR